MPKGRAWTPEEDRIVREDAENRVSARSTAATLGRTFQAVSIRRRDLGIRINRAFTPADDEVIRSEYARYTEVEVIAERLGRRAGDIRQRILLLGLRRNSAKTRIAQKFGVDALSLAEDPAAIRALFAEKMAQQKAANRAAENAHIEAILDELQLALAAGANRTAACAAAVAQGATLKAIGTRLGITRERVRQITTPGYRSKAQQYSPRGPRTIVCVRCKQPFEGKGARKYCEPCKAEYHRIYNAVYRANNREQVLNGKRTHMRRSRLQEKFEQMPPDEQAAFLMRVAANILPEESV